MHIRNVPIEVTMSDQTLTYSKITEKRKIVEVFCKIFPLAPLNPAVTDINSEKRTTKPVSRSCDHFQQIGGQYKCHSQPIRGQNPAHVTTLHQSEASNQVCCQHWEQWVSINDINLGSQKVNEKSCYKWEGQFFLLKNFYKCNAIFQHKKGVEDL